MGFAMRDFYVFMVAGEGLHKGLSALFDCLIYEHAELSRTIKMDGENYGNLKSFIDNRDDPELFIPFQNKLKTVTMEQKEEFDADDEIDYIQDDTEEELND